jgi:hypothetical protein
MKSLDRYVPVKDGSAFVVNDVFSPEVVFREEDFSLLAFTPRSTCTIYDIRDVINSVAKLGGARNNFKGLIGERILSVVLDELVASLIEAEKKADPGLDIVGKVLREEEAYEGKGYAVTYDNKYLLRYHGRTNFYVLQKTPLKDPDSWYQQERLGLKASEIDGLAYVHAGPVKYLLVGEVKTINSWSNIEGSGFYKHVTEELFPPFKSLFPRHELLFVFVGKREVLFDGSALKPYPQRLAEELENSDVRTVFIPFPSTPKTLDEYAADMYDMLPLTRKILSDLAKR